MIDKHNWYILPEQAPCRKLLTTLILDLEAHLFDTQHDIYMPNCDKRGFFRKKQVSVQGQTTHVTADICVCVATKTVWFSLCSPRCSAGLLVVSDVASAGVWTWMAWWSPPKADTRATWFVKGHPMWHAPLSDSGGRSSIRGMRWRWRSCRKSRVSLFNTFNV